MKSIKIISLLFSLTILSLLSSCSGNLPKVVSPDGNIIVTIENGENLNYSVQYMGQEIIAPSALGLQFRDHDPMFESLMVISTAKRNHDQEWERVWGRSKVVRDNFQELTIHLADTSQEQIMDVILRVFNDGVAIRYFLPEQENISGHDSPRCR